MEAHAGKVSCIKRKWQSSLHLPPPEAFAVCKSYDPPAGFLPDLTRPLLDHSYGESQCWAPFLGSLCPEIILLRWELAVLLLSI